VELATNRGTWSKRGPRVKHPPERRLEKAVTKVAAKIEEEERKREAEILLAGGAFPPKRFGSQRKRGGEGWKVPHPKMKAGAYGCVGHAASHSGLC